MIIKLSTRISTFLARLYKLEIFFFNPKKHSPLHRRSTQPREFRFKQTFYFLRMLSQTFRFSFHAQMVLNKMSFYMFLQQQLILASLGNHDLNIIEWLLPVDVPTQGTSFLVKWFWRKNIWKRLKHQYVLSSSPCRRLLSIILTHLNFLYLFLA